MSFSFISDGFKQALKQLFETAQRNLDSEDKDKKELANKIRALKGLFHDQNLNYLDNHLFETKKWALFDLNKLAEDVRQDDFKHLKYGAVILFVYLKEWGFRRGIKEGEQESHHVRTFYDFIYTQKNINYLEFKTFYDFVDELPYLICGEIYSNSRLSEIRKFLEEKDFSDFSNLVINTENTLEKIQQWEANFEQKQKSVLELEERLEKNKLTYDFILLSKGFQQLYDQKKIELKERRSGYAQFGTMLVCIPIAVIIVIIILILTGYEAKLSSLWFLALPITTLMLFLFYFTRVGLQHVRSVQSQMMQLELRMALCQFIHNYAEDSEKLHAKNSNGFEKFENIIFSPLVSSDDKIPTTFDGMEQLAKLVSEFRR